MSNFHLHLDELSTNVKSTKLTMSLDLGFKSWCKKNKCSQLESFCYSNLFLGEGRGLKCGNNVDSTSFCPVGCCLSFHAKQTHGVMPIIIFRENPTIEMIQISFSIYHIFDLYKVYNLHQLLRKCSILDLYIPLHCWLKFTNHQSILCKDRPVWLEPITCIGLKQATLLSNLHQLNLNG